MKAHEKMILPKKNHVILLLYLQLQKKKEKRFTSICYTYLNMLMMLYMPQLVFHLRNNKNPLDSKFKNLKITEKVM